MMPHYHDESPSSEDLDRFGAETGFCPGCGAEIWDDAPWCPECGDNPVGGVRVRGPGARSKMRILGTLLLVGAGIGLILAVFLTTPW